MVRKEVTGRQNLDLPISPTDLEIFLATLAIDRQIDRQINRQKDRQFIHFKNMQPRAVLP